MNMYVKVAIAAGGGAFLSQYLEPKLLELAKPTTDFAKKAINGAAVGIASVGIYYALGKAT